jgi:molecular chaperone HtpG
VDAKAGIVTIRDNGIGMTRDEAIAHLGTIARSGTAEFVKKLSGDQRKDSQLIGQFGVGFYSAFIVADRVEVLTRKAGASDSAGVHWESTADGEFTVQSLQRRERGTAITLHLKADAAEYADGYRLRGLIRRYSDHIGFPIKMRKQGEGAQEYETVNQARALWARARSEISAEEYAQFYQHIAHDSAEPLAHAHNKVEGKREYTSLLYIPGRAPFDLQQREAARGLKLYVQRVFIMDDAEQFLPLYLRFVKGVIDSNDLPLNVSRELLQQDQEVEAIKSGLTKRVLDMLAGLAKDEPTKYAIVWKEFGAVLKEGVAEDAANRDKLLPLLRFASSHSSENDANVSLDDYAARMKPDQQHIYYVVADNLPAARSSPYIEQLTSREIEVLLLGERIDLWIMPQLDAFAEKKFKDAARGDLDLSRLESEVEKQRRELDHRENKKLLKRVKDALGDRVADVRTATRLKDSPSCLVVGEGDLDLNMLRLLEAAGQKVPTVKPALEINVAHPIVKYLDGLTEAQQFEELALLLFDQAALAKGGSLSNAPEYAQRLNRLLVRLAGLGGKQNGG